MKERKSFQHLPPKENPHFLEDGKKIYLELVKKYGRKDVKSLDSILNILCCGLVCLAKENVSTDDNKSFLQLIYQILSKNLC
jgi:hypothetical protein